MAAELLAIGADGARGGWLAALAYGTTEVTRVDLQLVASFEQLVTLRGAAPEVTAAVDVPMGLLETVDLRPCDKQARALLGTRASTVFAPPSRPLLAAATYADARELIAAAQTADPSVKGLSAQAFGIAPKMREADGYLQANPSAQAWLWECHPELSFRALAAEVLPDKKSVAGQARRLRHLTERFPRVLDTLAGLDATGRAVETADALDALAALHTALRLRAGQHVELGGEPDATGLTMRMVF